MSSSERRDRIRATQTELLYDGVGLSALGTLLAASVLIAIFGPVSGYAPVLAWLAIMLAVYGVRVADLRAYRRRDPEVAPPGPSWDRRMRIGAICSALAWTLSLWLIYPEDNGAYEAILILILGGVSAGALATLPYDPKLNNAFQGVILAAVQARLWSEGGSYAITLAVVSLFVFGFMMSGGVRAGRHAVALLELRHDMERTNVEVLKSAGEMARLGYWQWSADRPAEVTLSEELAALVGASGRTWRLAALYRRVHPEDRPEVRRRLTDALKVGRPLAHGYRFAAFDGRGFRHVKQTVRPLSGSAGEAIALGAVQDVSDIKRVEDRVVRLAYHDRLTGLANRARFLEALAEAIAIAERAGERLAVIAIDLDEFSAINHSFGHERADAYLVAVARHLRRSVRSTDVVARIGGDEFALILRDANASSLETATARVLDLTRSPVSVGPYRVRPRLSAGVALFPDDAHGPDDLVARVEEALAHAKAAGPDTTVVVYDQGLENSRRARVALESDLRRALVDDELELWYQPKVDAAAGALVGVEALIRWRHPERGMVPPGHFIDAAERIGLIAEIGDWVMVAAARQSAAWAAAGLEIPVSVNIASGHFLSPGFAARVAEIIRVHRLGPGRLEIEITESTSRDPADQGRVCRELRELGVGVAIDDFGTGHSSLGILSDLEIDTIKIDRSFVVGLGVNPSAEIVIETVVRLARGLGFEVVAEGVETGDQLDRVTRAGCRVIQGYYFSPPVKAGKVPALAATRFGEPPSMAA